MERQQHQEHTHQMNGSPSRVLRTLEEDHVAILKKYEQISMRKPVSQLEQPQILIKSHQEYYRPDEQEDGMYFNENNTCRYVLQDLTERNNNTNKKIKQSTLDITSKNNNNNNNNITKSNNLKNTKSIDNLLSFSYFSQPTADEVDLGKALVAEYRTTLQEVSEQLQSERKTVISTHEQLHGVEKELSFARKENQRLKALLGSLSEDQMDNIPLYSQDYIAQIKTAIIWKAEEKVRELENLIKYEREQWISKEEEIQRIQEELQEKRRIQEESLKMGRVIQEMQIEIQRYKENEKEAMKKEQELINVCQMLQERVNQLQEQEDDKYIQMVKEINEKRGELDQDKEVIHRERQEVQIAKENLLEMRQLQEKELERLKVSLEEQFKEKEELLKGQQLCEKQQYILDGKRQFDDQRCGYEETLRKYEIKDIEQQEQIRQLEGLLSDMKKVNIELEGRLQESTMNGDRLYEELQNLQKVVREFSSRIPISARVPGSSNRSSRNQDGIGNVMVQDTNRVSGGDQEEEEEEDKRNVGGVVIAEKYDKSTNTDNQIQQQDIQQLVIVLEEREKQILELTENLDSASQKLEEISRLRDTEILKNEQLLKNILELTGNTELLLSHTHAQNDTILQLKKQLEEQRHQSEYLTQVITQNNNINTNNNNGYDDNNIGLCNTTPQEMQNNNLIFELSNNKADTMMPSSQCFQSIPERSYQNNNQYYEYQLQGERQQQQDREYLQEQYQQLNRNSNGIMLQNDNLNSNDSNRIDDTVEVREQGECLDTHDFPAEQDDDKLLLFSKDLDSLFISQSDHGENDDEEDNYNNGNDGVYDITSNQQNNSDDRNDGNNNSNNSNNSSNNNISSIRNQDSSENSQSFQIQRNNFNNIQAGNINLEIVQQYYPQRQQQQQQQQQQYNSQTHNNTLNTNEYNNSQKNISFSNNNNNTNNIYYVQQDRQQQQQQQQIQQKINQQSLQPSRHPFIISNTNNTNHPFSPSVVGTTQQQQQISVTTPTSQIVSATNNNNTKSNQKHQQQLELLQASAIQVQCPTPVIKQRRNIFKSNQF